ncbi:Clavaminate synthase-like protein [Atractiella rhizophila]|nr:Clavaminate synthase-like protein [Atractiella rhizophila]
MSSTLPIVDISPYLSPTSDSSPSSLTPSQLSCSRSIHSACLSHGFFYLTGFSSLIPHELQEGVLNVSRAFFELPLEEKERIGLDSIESDGARGYQRIGENVTMGKSDFHEGIDFYRPWPSSTASSSSAPTTAVGTNKPLPLRGDNLYPSNPSSFKSTITTYISKLQQLGAILVRATLVGLEVTSEEEERVLRDTKDSFWVFRTIGYPPLPGTHDGVSCGSHKDYGCYTLLFSDRTKGALQVLAPSSSSAPPTSPSGKEGGTEEGQEWIDADPLPNCLVVNIGEMWEIWTAGLYKSTTHRVVHRGDNYRISVPFFYEPNFDAKVEPLESLVEKMKAEGKEVEKKEGVVYGEFLMSKVAGNFVKPSDSE